jgi:hypothetical protein
MGTCGCQPDRHVLRGADMSDQKRCMVLLKFEGKEGPIYFVMDHKRHYEKDRDDDAQEVVKYFFEEHSCPTNWIHECVAVIEDGDADPHGFLQFVRSVDVPDDLNIHHDPWFELFPEIGEEK